MLLRDRRSVASILFGVYTYIIIIIIIKVIIIIIKIIENPEKLREHRVDAYAYGCDRYVNVYKIKSESV